MTALDRNEQLRHPVSKPPPRPEAALLWLAQLRPVQYTPAGEHSRRIGQYVEALERELRRLEARDGAAVEAGEVVTAVVAELDRALPAFTALERSATRMGAEADGDTDSAAGLKPPQQPSPTPRETVS